MSESDRLILQSDLVGRLSAFIADQSNGEFEELTQAVFAHQYQNNRPYRAFADLLGATPDSIANWQKIPAVPTSAFKLPNQPLTCGEPFKSTFLTSGTTTEIRGAHHFPNTKLYELAISQGWPLPILPTFFLAPSALEAPQSSLSHMFAHLNSGDDSHFLLRNSKFHLAPLFQYESRGAQPFPQLFLMGTALAFRHLMETHGPLPLPAGSHLLETGGYKGTSITLSKPDFYRQLSAFFSIPPSQLHNEYGMTELSSQAYATGPDGRHRFPHWCRHLILDPESGRQLPPGEIGYLVIHDLANLHSVAKIRTQDFAIGHPDGSFTLLGRDPGALPRGCSRTIDHALS
ncbi:MAG: hypothetical protein ACI8UZ_000439 [Akkermansiaceae bacterium]|jgi:hypothetical protein